MHKVKFDEKSSLETMPATPDVAEVGCIVEVELKHSGEKNKQRI